MCCYRKGKYWIFLALHGNLNSEKSRRRCPHATYLFWNLWIIFTRKQKKKWKYFAGKFWILRLKTACLHGFWVIWCKFGYVSMVTDILLIIFWGLHFNFIIKLIKFRKYWYRICLIPINSFRIIARRKRLATPNAHFPPYLWSASLR